MGLHRWRRCWILRGHCGLARDDEQPEWECHQRYGEYSSTQVKLSRFDTVTAKTSGGDYEMLAGNLASIGLGGIVAVVSSYIVTSASDKLLKTAG